MSIQADGVSEEDRAVSRLDRGLLPIVIMGKSAISPRVTFLSVKC